MLTCSYSTRPLLENYWNSSSFLNEIHDNNPPYPPICQREGWLRETNHLTHKIQLNKLVVDVYIQKSMTVTFFPCKHDWHGMNHMLMKGIISCTRISFMSENWTKLSNNE